MSRIEALPKQKMLRDKFIDEARLTHGASTLFISTAPRENLIQG